MVLDTLERYLTATGVREAGITLAFAVMVTVPLDRRIANTDH